MRSTAKILVNRLLYNLGIGIFFGAALAQADLVGTALLGMGVVIGFLISK